MADHGRVRPTVRDWPLSSPETRLCVVRVQYLASEWSDGRTVLAMVGRVEVRQVEDDQWSVVAWLWQLFRHDLAEVVGALPYADGRYQTRGLTGFPNPDGAGYLAWASHPNTGEDAPVGFALVEGLDGARRSVTAFWVAPTLRGEGLGMLLAQTSLNRHPGPWSIGFQHDNVSAGAFWRAVASRAFGVGAWSETRRGVPGRPGVPPDHWIETL